MALLFKASGARKKVTPANGKMFTLQELQQFVGGFIERVDMHNGNAMYINEDGKQLALKFNAAATSILKKLGCMPTDYIVGDAVILSYSEEE